MEQFFRVIEWVVVAFICLEIVGRFALIGKQREPVTVADAMISNLLNFLILYFLLKGL